MTEKLLTGTLSLNTTNQPFIFTLMAYSPPYFSVNGIMILVLAYKNGFKSKSVYYGLQENTFLFMAYRCRDTHINISVYDII